MDFFQTMNQFEANYVLWVQSHLSNPILDFLMPIVSTLGNAGLIWIFIAFCMIAAGKKNIKIRQYQKGGILLLFSLAITAVIANFILKPLFTRIRPIDFLSLESLIQRPEDFSFPSGHTAAAFSAATIFYAINPKAGFVMFLFAILMGFSRLYLAVHYPSDIIAGAVLGIIVSVFVLHWSKKRDKSYKIN